MYPTLDPATGELVTVDTLKVDPGVQLLFDYIYQRGTLIPITEYNRCAKTKEMSRTATSCRLWRTVVGLGPLLLSQNGRMHCF